MKPGHVANFWKKVNVLHNDLCWEWNGSKNRGGYGQCNIGGLSGAHRVSWVLHNGPIPMELCVLHSCDNPPCINPKHLFIGTNKDNTIDCTIKGRNKALAVISANNLARTHCKHGHPYDKYGHILPNGHRRCNECHRITGVKYRQVHLGSDHVHLGSR